MKKNNTNRINIFMIYAVIGILLLAGAAGCYIKNESFKRRAVETTGVIVDIQSHRDSDGDLTHSVYVSYSVNGKEYNNVPWNIYSNSMYVGQSITLYCDPKRPEKFEGESFIHFDVMVLSFMGIILSVMGFSPLISMVRRNVQIRHLLRNGHVIYAKVEDVEYDTSVSVNGMHPFIIRCNYKDENKDKTYRFKSNRQWTDSSSIYSPGSTIKVMVQEDDYSKYYVCPEDMQNKTVDYT